MNEHLVKNVRARHFDAKDPGDSTVVISWTRVSDNAECDNEMSLGCLAAVSVYLAQPTPPTPDDVARDLVNAWYTGADLTGVHIDSAKRTVLVQRIAAALEAAAEKAGAG